jgi:hypothetical protein
MSNEKDTGRGLNAASTRMNPAATLRDAMTLEYQAPEQDVRRPLVRDDVAYVLPMALFLTFVWVGGTWPSIYPISYVARVILVAVALAVLWRHYTKISWRYWWSA